MIPPRIPGFRTIAAGLAGLVLAVLGAAASNEPAAAQNDARRLGMGGIIVSGISGSAAQNVAYRAVPKPTGGAGYQSIPLPLGLIQVLADPPETDTDSPDFNVFELANLIGRTPWTLQLVQPEELSSDIIVDVAQNSLAVDLGELQRLFPDHSIRYGVSWQSPSFELGMKNVFVGIRPQVDGRNSLDLDEALQQALGEGAPFLPNTTYGASDEAQGQAAIAFSGGVALPLVPAASAPDGDPRKGGFAVYAGARMKYLSGVALWRGDAVGSFATGDTIFGSSTPVTAAYVADLRRLEETKFGAGKGVGADVGVALFVNRLEIGLGVQDLGSTITWDKTDLTRSTYDSESDVEQTVDVEDGVEFKSRFPVTGSLNLAYRMDKLLFGGTLDRTSNERWIPRAGVEAWAGPIPLRAGVYLD
ncbi:MAG: hypothetical protein ABIP29_03290, partial [Candidatus Eisenbacteria bacterium]